MKTQSGARTTQRTRLLLDGSKIAYTTHFQAYSRSDIVELLIFSIRSGVGIFHVISIDTY